jgi:PAS domain S-box-containing protein
MIHHGADATVVAHIPTDAFLRAFPFYLAWNDAGVIVETGPSLAKVCPEVTKGRRLTEALRLIRPRGELSPAFFRDNPDQLFIVEDPTNSRLLRGSYLALPGQDGGVLLGTPWITHPDQLSSYGLTIDDFAVHDQTLDLLLLLQTQQTSANDLKQLNAALVEKRARLIEQEASLRKLALVASATDNAVLLTDGEMRIEWINAAFSRMAGWTAKDVQQKRLWEFLAENAVHEFPLQAILECLEAGDVFRGELSQRRRDGTPFWMAIEAQRFDEARDSALVMIIGRDITARKRAEDALRQSELEARTQRDEARRQRDELEWIYNNASVGLCFFDRNLRYKRVNRWIAELNGRTIEDHIGRSVREIAPAFAPHLEEGARSVIRSRRPARYEGNAAETPSQPGVTRYFNESWHPVFDVDGAVSGLTLLVEEITDQRRVRALADADRRKNEFLATLAHELRNPLAPIKGALQLLQMTVGEKGAEEDNRKALRIAERQADHLVRLVDDLLEVARITHGKIELRMEEIDLLSILPQAIDLVRPHLEAKGHRLVYDAPTAPLAIRGDRVRLVQVFANLLDNAIKYTPPTGDIRLSARRDCDGAVVTVSDNGQGIPREKLASIFDLFSQVEYGPRETRSGIGIGLALARSMIELHGGRIGASSEGVGRGSEFTVAMPLTQAVAAMNRGEK